MPGYLIKTSTFRVGGRDFHMQSLLDAEQFHDPLGEAADLRMWELAFMRSEPWFDPLRGGAGYAALVRRINYPKVR